MTAPKKRNPARVAELSAMLAKMPKSERDALLGRLAAEDAGLADELRKSLFPFEELSLLQDEHLRALLGRVPRPTLTLALRGCDEALLAKILGALPARAGQELHEEIQSQGPRKLSDVNAARDRLTEIARELEEQGALWRRA